MPHYQFLLVWKKNASFLVSQTLMYNRTVLCSISISVQTHKLWSRVGPRGKKQSSSDDYRTVKDSAYRTLISKEDSVRLKGHNAAQVIIIIFLKYTLLTLRLKIQMLDHTVGNVPLHFVMQATF